MLINKVKAGTVCNVPVSTLDLLPAFINAAGDDAGNYPALQGMDIVRLTKHLVCTIWHWMSQKKTILLLCNRK
uniref:hypothetical protein n=1 Tax=Pedobacter schmidteae TaxID=2201271 RepID=UPI000EB242F3|nr:hypothetical protein [Pedobacter schmidteae]